VTAAGVPTWHILTNYENFRLKPFWQMGRLNKELEKWVFGYYFGMFVVDVVCSFTWYEFLWYTSDFLESVGGSGSDLEFVCINWVGLDGIWVIMVVVVELVVRLRLRLLLVCIRFLLVCVRFLLVCIRLLLGCSFVVLGCSC
jgi:hypothetical protein